MAGGADWLPEAGTVVAVTRLAGGDRQLTLPPVGVPVKYAQHDHQLTPHQSGSCPIFLTGMLTKRSK
jgi:hypothetical protein